MPKYSRFFFSECIPSIETSRSEWSVTGVSCSHLRLRASPAYPTLMSKSSSSSSSLTSSSNNHHPSKSSGSNFQSFSQWLSIPKTSMSNLWTWSSSTTSSNTDGRLSKQLQASLFLLKSSPTTTPLSLNYLVLVPRPLCLFESNFKTGTYFSNWNVWRCSFWSKLFS